MVKRYVISLGVFLLKDIVWLAVIAPKFYNDQIGHLMSEKVNWAAALVFYLIYIAAVLFFVVNPALLEGGVKVALMRGALLGFAMYATYDLTNLATLRDWPLLVTIVDLVWGTFITATTGGIATYVMKRFGW